MDLARFTERIRECVKEGDTLKNLGGNDDPSGDSPIEHVSNMAVEYLRNTTPITLEIAVMHRAYREVAGRRVSTTDLKNLTWTTKFKHKPCNATFFMQVLIALGIVEGICGTNPFQVRIPPIEASN